MHSYDLANNAYLTIFCVILLHFFAEKQLRENKAMKSMLARNEFFYSLRVIYCILTFLHFVVIVIALFLLPKNGDQRVFNIL